MRKIYMMLLAAASAVMAISSCQKAEPFYTATEDDTPRILNSTFDTNGGQNTFTSVYRDEPFTFTTIVTPALYTTVDWYFDGEYLATEKPIAEGQEREGISVLLPAGVYDVMLVATTTKGKETFRTGILEVLAYPEDPALATDAKSRWLQIGTKATVKGSNLEGVTKAYIKGEFETKAISMKELEGFENTGSALSFNVPEIAEGDYKILLETNDGAIYGAGTFGVHIEKYVDPGKIEKILWKGEQDVVWDNTVIISAEDMAEVPVGTVLRFNYYMTPDERISGDIYHCIRITNNDWTNDIVPQVDGIETAYPTCYEVEYTEAVKAIVDAGGSMVVAGYGYTLTSITYEVEGGGSVEINLWKGEQDVVWDNTVILSAETLAEVPVGTVIRFNYYMTPDERFSGDIYHCIRITNNDWTNDIVPQVDGIETSHPDCYELEYTEAVKAIVDTGGSMVVAGYGYTLTSVTYMGAAPVETTLWEGEKDVTWENTVTLSAEAMAAVEVGKTLTCYYYMTPDERISGDVYHCIRITNNDWTNDIVPQVDGIETSHPDCYEVKYTEAVKAIVDAGGSMVVAGYGYTLTKVAVK